MLAPSGDAVKGSIHQAADSRLSAGTKVRSVGGSQLDHVRPILAGARLCRGQPTPAYECSPVMNTCTTKMLNIRLVKPSS
jgi:hypothetical protein